MRGDDYVREDSACWPDESDTSSTKETVKAVTEESSHSVARERRQEDERGNEVGKFVVCSDLKQKSTS